MAQQKPLNWLEFQQKFSSEEACRQHLFEIRWSDGFRCPRCGYTRSYELVKHKLHQGVKCSYQVSVIAGTVMHKTRTPLMVWFWVVCLVSNDKRGVSAVYLSQQFDISYPTSWLCYTRSARP